MFHNIYISHRLEHFQSMKKNKFCFIFLFLLLSSWSQHHGFSYKKFQTLNLVKLRQEYKAAELFPRVTQNRLANGKKKKKISVSTFKHVIILFTFIFSGTKLSGEYWEWLKRQTLEDMTNDNQSLNNFQFVNMSVF